MHFVSPKNFATVFNTVCPQHPQPKARAPPSGMSRTAAADEVDCGYICPQDGHLLLEMHSEMVPWEIGSLIHLYNFWPDCFHLTWGIAGYRISYPIPLVHLSPVVIGVSASSVWTGLQLWPQRNEWTALGNGIPLRETSQTGAAIYGIGR